MAKAKKTENPQEKAKFWDKLRALESNTLILSFSFVCAVVVWFVMMGTQLEGLGSVVSNVPIEIELSEAAQEAGVRIFERSHNSTDVSVTGNARVTAKLTTEDVGVKASFDPPLSMLTGSSMQEATVTLRAYKKGNTLAEYEVEGVSPSEVTVVYDKYKEMQLSIENKVQYAAAEGYYASSAPTLSTDIITISGPESQVNRVSVAALDYVFSEPLTQSRAISCKVTLYDVNGEVIDPTTCYLSLSDDTVDVSIAVTGRQTVTLQPDIRDIPQNFASNRITISPETIEIAGDSEIISRYPTLTLGTPINFYEVTPQNNTFQVAIPMPAGATNISKVEYATVTFNMNGYQQTTLKTDNINVINAPSGKVAELITKNLNVQVIGTAAQISKLTGASVFCTADLSVLTEFGASAQVPVTITINGADSCWVTGTYTVGVTLKDEVASSDDAE